MKIQPVVVQETNRVRIEIDGEYLRDGATGEPAEWNHRDLLYPRDGELEEFQRVVAACRRFWGERR